MNLLTVLKSLDRNPDLDRPLFWRWYSTRRMLSNLVWDLHSTHTYCAYQRVAGSGVKGTIAKRGFVSGPLEADLARRLEELFEACPKSFFDGFDFKDGYFFEPRASVHEYFNRTNDYFELSAELEAELSQLLLKMAPEIESICGHFWRVASVRLFSLKSGFNSGAVHLDGWPLAMKKLFIYPRGANVKKGTTYIRTRDGQETTVESESGLWMIFENSLVEHQAILPKEDDGKPRQTIEIDLIPSFVTDTRLVRAGVNGWYPWFPVDEGLDSKDLVEEFRGDRVAERQLRRIAGLALELFPKDYSLKLDDFLTPPEEDLKMPSAFIKSNEEVPAERRALIQRVRRGLGRIKRGVRKFGRLSGYADVSSTRQ